MGSVLSSDNSDDSSNESKMKKSRSVLEEMETPSAEQVKQLFAFPEGVELLKTFGRGTWRPDALTRESILLQDDGGVAAAAELAKVRAIWKAGELSAREQHAMAASIALVIGDALGAPLEFRPVDYDPKAAPRLTGFDEAVWKAKPGNKFDLLPGQWTDDASMSLCLAESLLKHGRLDPHDLRLRFLLWWQLGYCNAFGYDTERLHGGSVGLGGNIGSSFEEFKDLQTL
jgi:hypothetical protein